MKSTKILSLLSVAALLLASTPAFALVDIRGGYGVNNGDPSDVNGMFVGPTVSDFKSLNGLTADAMIHLPLIGLGFGLRFEDMSSTLNDNVSGGTLNRKLEVQRTSAVVDYRLIDTLVYIGGIATYGLSHNIKYSYTCPSGGFCTGLQSFDGSANSPKSYSVGIEGGLKLALLTVGAEVGYSVITATNFSSGAVNPLTNTSGSTVGYNFSGAYFKILAGVTF